MDNPDTAHKHCRTCDTTKTTAEFYRDASKKDGLRTQCKACVAVRHTLWAEANPERNAAHSRKWREANPEKVAASNRVSDAKRTARSIKRAHRYIHAFEYFEGRQGWTDALAATVLRDPRGRDMEWMVPELDDYVAEYV